MSNTCWRPAAALALAALTGLSNPAQAAFVSFSGALDDPGNAALVASDLGPAQFTDDLATANNVALHGFSVALAGNARIASTGFAAGGIDPYVTLFSGSDRATATFVASNADNATTGGGGDFVLDILLAPGAYTLAIGVFQNMSFAENSGGVLADGFIGLGGPLYFGDGRYAVGITLPDGGTVPEPGAAGLVLAALLAAAAAGRRARNQRRALSAD
jgi:hypothetical protein